MTFNKIKQRYPNSRITQTQTTPVTHHYLFDGEVYLEIPLTDINENELFLLNELFNTRKPESIWQQYLIKEIPIQNRSLHHYTIIQFNTTVSETNKEMYLTTLRDYFNEVEDAFFINERFGILVLQSEEIDLLELGGFINTLDDDFSTNTSLYIGEPNTLGETHLEKVKEEFNLFREIDNPQPVSTFKTTYLNSYVKPLLKESLIVNQVLEKIKTQQDHQSLIATLWKNEGNISKTAQDLYIHRNTLNYRLDKFYEEVGLSLRDLDDLLLCYLINL